MLEVENKVVVMLTSPGPAVMKYVSEGHDVTEDVTRISKLVTGHPAVTRLPAAIREELSCVHLTIVHSMKLFGRDLARKRGLRIEVTVASSNE